MPRLLFAVGTLSLSFAALANPSTAWVAECEARLPLTRIEVKVQASPIVHDFRQDVQALTRRHAPGRGQLTLGLTERTVQTSFQTKNSLLTRPTEPLACMRPDVSVTLSLAPHTVFIAREFKQGTCGFAHIAEHELKHVQVNEMALSRTAAALRQALLSSFGQRVFYGSPDQLQKALTTHLHEWLEWTKVEMDKTLVLHEAIDSPQEYARNRTVCAGEIDQILSQRRR